MTSDETPIEHDAWVIAILVGELHMSAGEIGSLGEVEAIELVHKHWARERS